MIKQCSSCRRILSFDDFHNDSKSKDGKRSICKSCANAKAAKSKAQATSRHGGLLVVWYDMIKRCYDARDASFKRYGGRGITICDEWLNDRSRFVSWAESNGYRRGLQIDRIDNDKGYSPSNCRFVTRSENQHNTSQTRLDEKAVSIIRGNSVSRRMTQRQLAKKLCVSQANVSYVSTNKAWRKEK